MSHPTGVISVMDRVTEGIARTQDGLITVEQARSAGLSDRSARSRVESGRWERLHPGVYRIAGAPRSWRQDILAACLAVGPAAVASHRSAAGLWGLDGIGPGWVELSVSRPASHRLPGVIVHRSTDLAAGRPVVRTGIPLTDPARTILDLGAVLPAWRVEAALESALSRRLVTLAGLRSALDAVARRGRRGAGVLRGLLDQRSDAARLSESVLEARVLRLFHDHFLPEPVAQHEVRVGQRLVGRVDFAYPPCKVAIEVDGYEAHSSLSAFGRDRARQNELVTAGWTVLRFTWDDVVHRPERVVGVVRQVLVAIPAQLQPKSRQERSGVGSADEAFGEEAVAVVHLPAVIGEVGPLVG
jgi:very-short-patch-repair endonuclease